jgi:hypothetical protein
MPCVLYTPSNNVIQAICEIWIKISFLNLCFLIIFCFIFFPVNEIYLVLFWIFTCVDIICGVIHVVATLLTLYFLLHSSAGLCFN